MPYWSLSLRLFSGESGNVIIYIRYDRECIPVIEKDSITVFFFVWHISKRVSPYHYVPKRYIRAFNPILRITQ